MRPIRQWLLLALFALAMAWVEAAAVMYLRVPLGRVQPYQAHPLPTMAAIGPIELVREVATLVMLAAVATLAGWSRRSRFAFFLIAFALWDMGYYVFLRWMGDWPRSMLDWDILFLLPLPWWGPVLAPLLISLVMLCLGLLLTAPWHMDPEPRVSMPGWIGAAVGACLAVGVFIRDAALASPGGTQAVLDVLPERFLWLPFLAALGLMGLPLVLLGWRLVFARRATESDTAAGFRTEQDAALHAWRQEGR